MAKVVDDGGSTANRYQILAKLAAGGMAEIFLARGASVAGVERYCVLKRILREKAKDAQFVQMFVDEARLAAQLHHPNIASVYDVGMLGESYFFTMEYVHGETIRSLLERAQELRRTVPLACVLTIIAGTAAGLHHAHERNASDGRPLGIVHRDVSPANLMVSYEGNVKVVDFGVAKAADRDVETKSGTVKGKISYLSPEQCRGAPVDRRSDLFSLGIVMWEMLTGARLYRRDSDYDNMTAIVNEPPPPPSSRRPEVPRAVDDIVLRLLAKSVTARFQTADEVLEAVENASMQARTILSTSAVSRLLRDLFGVRAEPWLNFDGDTIRHDPVTVGSRPLADPLEGEALDLVELELASVLELSVSYEIVEPDAAAELPSARAEPPPPVRPSHPAIPLTPAPPPAGPVPVRPATRPSQPPVPAPARPSPAEAALLELGMARPAGTGPTNSTLLGVSAPPGSTSASPSAPFLASARFPAQPAPPGHHAAPPGASPAEPTASKFRTTPGLGSGARPARAASGPPTAHEPPHAPPRIAWRLVAVIVVAAAFGVIAAWIAMRTDRPRTPQVIGGAPLGALPSAVDAGSLDASPEPPSVAPAATDLLDAAPAEADAAVPGAAGKG